MAEQRNIGLTEIKRVEQYKDRWTSFGANTGIIEISEKLTPAQLRKFEIFQEYDDQFLERISPDISIARWKKTTMLFEEGSYIDIAFFLVNGSVDVYLEKQRAHSSGPIFDSSRTVLSLGTEPLQKGQARGADRTVFQMKSEQEERRGREKGSKEITFLSVMDFDIPSGGVIRLGPGEIFGEIGALSGWPQSVTAKTVSQCDLVQIRVPALRLMRRKSNALKSRIDKVYKERSLLAQLKATPLFRGVSEEFVKALCQKVELVSCDPDEVITKEGEYPDAFYIVRSGFVKLSQRLGEGQVVVSYLSKGSTLGETELLIDGTKGWLYTASSKEYTELVKISREDYQQIVASYPMIEKSLWSSVVARLKEAGYNKRNIGQSEFIDTALNAGLVEGNSILVIDLNVCTRCDDCVRGCADTHGGIPRFVREGDKYENFIITRACIHCQDPVCLVGCPTGAIRRAAVGDVVEIVDSLCIGCQTCAKNCPYDAIVMHPTKELWPDNMIPEGLRGKERMLATKCDLCYSSTAGPACVSSCPHHCAFRVSNIGEFQQLLAKG